MSENPNKVVAIGLRIVLIASLLLLLLATATETLKSPTPESPIPPNTDSITNDNIIVPGVRIGPATLGSPIGRLRSLLDPGQLRPEGKGTVYLYPEIGLAIYTENERIISVTSRSPAFVTRNGIGVGSDISQALELLPGAHEMEGSGKTYKLHSWGEGWHIEITDDKISSFQITVKLTTGLDS